MMLSTPQTAISKHPKIHQIQKNSNDLKDDNNYLYQVPLHNFPFQNNQKVQEYSFRSVQKPQKSTRKHKKKFQNQIKLGPWDQQDSFQLKSKMQTINNDPDQKANRKKSIMNSLQNYSRSSHKEPNRTNKFKNNSQASIKFVKNQPISYNQTFHQITSPQQKLKWCLELQFMMKKRKRISNMLRLKQSAHYRSRTIISEKSEQKYLPEYKQRNNSLVQNQSIQGINKQAIKNAAKIISKKDDYTKTYNTLDYQTQQYNYNKIHSNRNSKYEGFLNTKKTEKKNKWVKNPNQRTPSRNKELNIYCRTETAHKTNQNQYQNHKVQINSPIIYKNRQENVYTPSKQSQIKIQSIKDKLKRIKYFKHKNKQDINTYHNQNNKIHTQNKLFKTQDNSYSQNQSKMHYRTGFGSYRNQIESCTINKINLYRAVSLENKNQ